MENYINFILVAILLLIVGFAVVYIRKEKKKGTRCIGCPAGGCCSGKGCGKEHCNESGNCTCHTNR